MPSCRFRCNRIASSTRENTQSRCRKHPYEGKHFRGMELALNGVNCGANNCFDINGVPYLGEQMNAGQPRPWAETGWSAFFQEREES